MVKSNDIIAQQLIAAGFPDPNIVSVEIRWVSAQDSQRLNARHRQTNQPTDVLSFPIYSYEEIQSLRNPETRNPPRPTRVETGQIPDTQKRLEPILLGSLVLCLEVIEKYAKEEGMSTQERIEWSIKHGLKHLLGYDHNPDGTNWFPQK
jgi:probable rRNA maturation factor